MTTAVWRPDIGFYLPKQSRTTRFGRAVHARRCLASRPLVESCGLRTVSPSAVFSQIERQWRLEWGHTSGIVAALPETDPDGQSRPVFLDPDLRLPARARCQQQPRMVPRPQIRIRAAREAAVPAPDRRSRCAAEGDQPALRGQSEAGRRLDVPHPSRHPLRRRQDAVQALGRRQLLPPGNPRGDSWRRCRSRHDGSARCARLLPAHQARRQLPRRRHLAPAAGNLEAHPHLPGQQPGELEIGNALGCFQEGFRHAGRRQHGSACRWATTRPTN